jgi:hypothetical protein
MVKLNIIPSAVSADFYAMGESKGENHDSPPWVSAKALLLRNIKIGKPSRVFQREWLLFHLV